MSSCSLVFPSLLLMTQKTSTLLCEGNEPIKDELMFTSCYLIECYCTSTCFTVCPLFSFMNDCKCDEFLLEHQL